MNEKGAVFPVTLVLTLIALFVLTQAASAYISQTKHLNGIRQYYKREITLEIQERRSYEIRDTPTSETRTSTIEEAP